MSWLAAEEPEARTPPACRALETVIVPRPRDIGGFEVRPVLPSAAKRRPLRLLRPDGTPLSCRPARGQTWAGIGIRHESGLYPSLFTFAF